MTMYINHDALVNISRSLSDAGENLDAANATAPKSVDAGTGTPAILGIMAHLADNAGQLVVAVKAVSDAITSANRRYFGQDEELAESLEQAMEKG
ncbi:hypothetical protein [Mycolicibacterium litorale]|uniref:hypothetical protein n=1 Tax=Mycolicibacterium litorale TaxID=758802 RepID=UPI0039A2E6A2